MSHNKDDNEQENIPIEGTDTSDLFAVRKAKLDEMRSRGIDPFRANWDQEHTSEKALSLYCEDEEKSPVVSVAGRILVFRLMGKASFIKIQDRAGQIQLYVRADVIGEDAYAEFKKLDIGDIIGSKGTLFKTKTGEISIRATEYKLVSKALRPLPEKWHGITDSDQIYRERHLDMIMNQESRKRLLNRSRIVQEIRKFLWSQEFVEVETPMLQNIPGGAAAKPFITHMNALNHDFYLRISLELYLKRMLVGGVERVFELGRNFRNEGLSRKHNPEFTMLEVYQSYTDFRGMMKLIYNMIQHLCKEVIGTTTITQANGDVIELGGQWREARYKDLIMDFTKDKDWFSRSKTEKLKFCEQIGLHVDPSLYDYEITNTIFGKLIEPTLIQPTFVTHLEKEVCPLAKINEEDPSVIDVFELCINGQEVAPSYSEQNDPFVQRQMFEAQAGEEIQNVDYEFIEALEHGMPPAGGMGVGIDRLVILLTGASNIRDTILFPTLKPLA